MESNGIFGGGNVHMDILANIYRDINGTKVIKFVTPFKFQQFDLFSNTIALTKALFSPIDKKYEELYPKAIVIAPNPYPFYFITALKVARSVKGYPVIYFHHISLSLKFIKRRGILRTLINYFMHLFLLSVCKILSIPIFLDNPKNYNIKGISVFKDEDAPNVLVTPKSVEIYKEFDLCYVGRFERHKGAMDLIKVVIILKKHNLNVKVAIVGHTNEKFKMKVSKILKDQNIFNNFTFFGTVTNEVKVKVLYSSKIYLHLSYEEGWSMSIMDAAYIGIPIIAYNLSAYSYLKGNYCAIQVGDINEAAESVANILSNYSNAVQVAKEAKRIVSAYNYLEIAKNQLESYNEIIKNGIYHYWRGK